MNANKATDIMLFTTLGCNSSCAHCCLECSPEKIKVKISLRDTFIYIGQARYYGASHVIITGGEPMLNIDEVKQIVKFASQLDMYTDLRTNGYWARDKEIAYSILSTLQKLGLNRIGLSYDSYHAKYIPIENIKNILEVASRLNMEVYIDWTGSESREYIKSTLGIDDAVLRYAGQPLKVGKAAIELDDSHFNKLTIEDVEKWTEVPEFCNFNCPSIAIFPGGYTSYSPCCWIHPMLITKVTGANWLENLIHQMDNNSAVNYLEEYGLKGLLTLGKEKNLLKDYYSHPCEVCFDLLPVLFPLENKQLPWYLRDGHSLRKGEQSYA